MNFLSPAKFYFELGFNVFPAIGKEVHINWKEFQTKRQSLEDLEKLNFNTNTDSIALLGAISSIRIIDFDKVTDFEIIKDAIKILGLPLNYEWIVKSGNGYHIYFIYSGSFYAEAINEKSGKASYLFFSKNQNQFEKLELFWGAHLITAPPSIHANGNKYEFINGKPTNKPRSLSDQTKIHSLIKQFCKLKENATPRPKPDHKNQNFDTDEIQKAVDILKTVNHSYDQWLKLAFSFASIGEAGRKYFIEMSIENPNHNDTEEVLNKKFDEILANKKDEITIATLFKVAKEFGYKPIKQQAENISYLNVLIESEKVFDEMRKSPINFKSPLVKMGSINLIYPGTVNLIQGAFGSHKSRLAEHIISALLNITDNKILGMECNKSEKESYIIYSDTERESEVIGYAFQNILEHAGYFHNSKIEDKFSIISFIEIPRKNRLDALKEFVNYKIEQYPNRNLIVVLDLLSDFVIDFNNQIESSNVLDFINDLRTSKNVTFICILHENPGANKSNPKARGHIGSLVADKSTLICSIGYVKNSKKILSLNFLKSRRNGIPDPIKLKYDEDKKCLTEADPSDFENLVKEKAPLSEVQANLFGLLMPTKENEIKEINKGEIVKKLTEIFGVGERTIRTRLEEIESQKFVDPNGYYLKINNAGTYKIYSLSWEF
ncbi:MAG: PriCT-2 domain-containing protein [Ignavibacteriales bacterium]|nr:PriCT-2 domain-containing protein [Ignavibacteriales bacterium]